MIGTQVGLIPKPQNKYLLLIILSPVKAYFDRYLDVLIETRYSRAASGGVGFAKAAGNYAAALLPTELAGTKGCHEVV